VKTVAGEGYVSVEEFTEYKGQVEDDFGAVRTDIGVHGNRLDELETYWQVELNNNKRITGLYLTGTDTTASMKFVLDQFSMYLPDSDKDIQVFEAGTFDGEPALFMTGAIIKDVIRSENFRWGEGSQWSGWKLDPNGALYAAGIQIKDSQGRTILSSGAGIDWDLLFDSSGFEDQVNSKVKPSTIDAFFASGSLSDADFSTYMESIGVQSAWIKTAIIETAHIKNLMVSTDKIQANGVTQVHTSTKHDIGDISDWLVATLFWLPHYMSPEGSKAPLVHIIVQTSLAVEQNYSDYPNGVAKLILKRADFNEDWSSYTTTVLASAFVPVKHIYDDGNGGLGIQYVGDAARGYQTFSYIDGAYNILYSGNKDYFIELSLEGDYMTAVVDYAEITCVEYRR